MANIQLVVVTGNFHIYPHDPEGNIKGFASDFQNVEIPYQNWMSSHFEKKNIRLYIGEKIMQGKFYVTSFRRQGNIVTELGLYSSGEVKSLT